MQWPFSILQACAKARSSRSVHTRPFQELGFRVWGLRFLGVGDFGFRALGLGLGACRFRGFWDLGN